jgi:uncharacterized protein (TIGR03067 family)
MAPWPPWGLALLILTVSARAGGDITLKDVQAMQGSWKVAELTEKGRRVPAKETDPIVVVIVGTRMTIRDDGAAREEIVLKVDASKTPGAADFTYTKGPSTGNMERAIYSIDGDTLKFCINEAKDGPRPTAFASTRSNAFAYVVLTRIKPK